MVWTLLPHLTACVSRDDVMLLDLRQDRYFRLPRAIRDDARVWLEEGGVPPKTMVSTLLRQGVLQRAEAARMTASKLHIAIPAEQLTTDAHIRPDLRTGIAVASCVTKTWTELRVRPLQKLIERVRLRRTLRDADLKQSTEAVAAYESVRRLVPFEKNCLLDSLALDSWLGEKFAERQLVFGVTFEPFLAHCWLQAPEVLLNESCDRARRFHPILVA